MTLGACYIRVSTDEQTEFSPAAQLRVLKNYAGRNKILLPAKHIYIDEGVSGRRADKRPAFMQMIAAAKTKPKPFDVILVHKFDRFARSREDSVVYKSMLKREADIRVISITETIEDDKFSLILESMLEAMAEYYSLNLADEVKKGMTEKALQGGYQTTPPYGYRMVDKRLVIEPEEAAVVRFIFHEFGNRQKGFRELAEYANSLGLKTKRGNPFESRTVEYMLNNPVYIGKARWTPTGKTRRNYHNPDSIIARGEHSPLVDIQLWQKVQTVLGAQKEFCPKYQKPDSCLRTWLKGLVRCSNCGGSLVCSAEKYLQCCKYAKGACSISHCVSIKFLEVLVLEQLAETYKNRLEINIPSPDRNTAPTVMQDLNKALLSHLLSRKQRIREAYLNGVDSLEEYRENKEKLEAEQKLLEARTERPKSGHSDRNLHFLSAKSPESLRAFFTDDTIDIRNKSNAARFLIERITYNKPKNLLILEWKSAIFTVESKSENML